MKMESPSFTEQDLRDFFDEVRAYQQNRPLDGMTVVERLEAALTRIDDLVIFMGVLPPSGRGTYEEWSPHEILAHIVLVCQVLGWAMWAIGSGDQDEISLMSFLSLRDVSGKQFARVPAAELLAVARTELTSSIEFLCMADPAQMGRLGRVGPFELTAVEIGELLLCAHVELHVEQLERALETSRRTASPELP